MWKLAAGAEPAVLDDHHSWVWTAAFSSDGETLASGGSDNRLRLWPTHGAWLVEKICHRLPARDLDATEWRRYLGEGVDPEPVCP